MSGNFSEWRPNISHVQAGMVDGQYAHGGHTLLAAGPPRLANVGGSAAFGDSIGGNAQRANQIVMPIGIVQNFSVNHSRQWNQIFEIGSERSYFLSGRTVGQMGLGRVYYHGASLLRMLYAYYQDAQAPTVVPAMWPNAGAAAMANPHDVIIPPGYENIYMNLASDLFGQPIGLMMYLRDNNEQALGAAYFESVVLPSHALSTDAQGVLLQEQVSMQFERAVPVSISGVTLLSSGGTNSGGANLGETYTGYPGS